MRISDWSSDVCSSDLHALRMRRIFAGERGGTAETCVVDQQIDLQTTRSDLGRDSGSGPRQDQIGDEHIDPARLSRTQERSQRFELVGGQRAQNEIRSLLHESMCKTASDTAKEKQP